MANKSGTKRPEKFAEVIAKNGTVKDAMVAAGYSEKTANKGWSAVTEDCIDALHARGVEVANLGSKLTPEFTRRFIRGAAYRDALKGKDTAQMLKLLGQDRDVSHFQAESVVGIYNIQLPNAPQSNPPTIEAVCVDAPKLLGE